MIACTGPSYKGNDLRELFRRANERCGKPALWRTITGPLCEDCMKRLEDASKPGAPTIVGMMKLGKPWKRPIQ